MPDGFSPWFNRFIFSNSRWLFSLILLLLMMTVLLECIFKIPIALFSTWWLHFSTARWLSLRFNECIFQISDGSFLIGCAFFNYPITRFLGLINTFFKWGRSRRVILQNDEYYLKVLPIISNVYFMYLFNINITSVFDISLEDFDYLFLPWHQCFPSKPIQSPQSIIRNW